MPRRAIDGDLPEAGCCCPGSQGPGEHALADIVPQVHAITDRIAITNIVSANDPATLKREGFTPAAILCLDPRSQARYGHDGRTLVSMVDGENPPEVFYRAVAALAQLLAVHPRVLVHCHAGRSRSVVVVAACLAWHEGLEPDTALARVAARRPCASIMPGLLVNLRQRPRT